MYADAYAEAWHHGWYFSAWDVLNPAMREGTPDVNRLVQAASIIGKALDARQPQGKEPDGG
jgi:hypothetical protein